MTEAAQLYRFEVALSFPGEHRERIDKIAHALADCIGQKKVLYDKYLGAEFARPNLDLYLPNLYRTASRLLVFFFCGDYARKQWCGLEWRVGRDLLKHHEDHRLMFLRLDHSDVPGLYSIDGYLDISDMSVETIVNEILARLAMSCPADAEHVHNVVTEVRYATFSDIKDRCGTIRVLTMERPVDLSGLYTDVNILEKRSAHIRKTKEQLTHETQPDSVHRVNIPPSTPERVSGLKVLDRYQRVMIYGKPGAGKTTFLKRLATECADGKFRPELVPIFVTLKDFAEAQNGPSLRDYIVQQSPDVGSQMAVVLRAGRALVLLDGLDEVRDQDFVRARKALEAFTVEHNRCVVVLTCRIAAREYLFERFAEVEMADFNKRQIEVFSRNWFDLLGEGKRARSFLTKLKANQPIYELASSPLLLTLLCLIFQERNDFDGTRSELYKEGIDVLLRKWDAKRGIERDRPYGLTLGEMETLLGEIAYRRFLTSEYFFDQSSLEKQVETFFNERDLLRPGQDVSSERVLNSVESHLGLLVKRAANVYSFSHLTFQEFLTAQRIARKPSLLSEVGPYIGEQKWREVWLLLATMIDADDIIVAQKTWVDRLVADKPGIQKYLEWCRTREAGQSGHKPAALRALLVGWGLGRDHGFELALALEPELESEVKAELELDRAVESLLETSHLRTRGTPRHWARARALDLGRKRARDPERELELYRGVVLNNGRRREMELMGVLRKDFARVIEVARSRENSALSITDPQFATRLDGLRNEMPRDPAAWWRQKWLEWDDRLVAASRLRYGGQGRTLTAEQSADLACYYSANLLLMECVRAARGLTMKTRQYVEATMLLPNTNIWPLH